MKQLSPEKLQELEFSKDWCLFICDFMLEGIEKTEPQEAVQLYKGVKNVIKGTFERSSLTGMKMLVRDMNAWTKEMSRTRIAQLNVLLLERFGKNLESAKPSIEVRVGKIVARGKIKTVKEYELLYDYYEEFSVVEDKNGIMQKVAFLLDDFNVKKI